MSMREWKISKTYAGGEYFYQIYRIRNEAEPDHSGNREVIGTLVNMEVAEKLLAIVNGEEAGKERG